VEIRKSGKFLGGAEFVPDFLSSRFVRGPGIFRGVSKFTRLGGRRRRPGTDALRWSDLFRSEPTAAILFEMENAAHGNHAARFVPDEINRVGKALGRSDSISADSWPENLREDGAITPSIRSTRSTNA
jgi:hypothetical protein